MTHLWSRINYIHMIAVWITFQYTAQELLIVDAACVKSG